MASTRVINVLNDDDVEALTVMADIIAICAKAIDDDANGLMFAPPRLNADLGEGRLVFTAGGNDEAVGFRAYDTFPASKQDQLVAVWHPHTGELAGVVVGELLGAMRTGALGGVAIDRLVPVGASTCAVIGTGLQARTQLMACASVRDLTDVVVFSRDEASRTSFASAMAESLGIKVRAADTVIEALAFAEIALVATNSGLPVAPPEAFADLVHISTVGPKFVGYNELPAAAVEAASIVVSDSPQQIHAQGESHFLHESEVWPRIQHLGGLTDSGGRSVFLSAGLAGTEVLIANHLLR